MNWLNVQKNLEHLLKIVCERGDSSREVNSSHCVKSRANIKSVQFPFKTDCVNRKEGISVMFFGFRKAFDSFA